VVINSVNPLMSGIRIVALLSAMLKVICPKIRRKEGKFAGREYFFTHAGSGIINY